MSKGLHPRVLIAGTGSGSGKTTMTCALLMALKTRGKTPVAFKCGPDYIDPMFHRKVTGVFSGNLDLFLMGEDSVWTHWLVMAHWEYFIWKGLWSLY